ncbi:GntR family transcriptional regulator [Saccharopolyspora sp. K220]|uniref:FadR/GntR family transcriptional regulator n=1 Tax=Saccharopolyspora soli TaxID=2926618 RepID=UPI001F588FC7|nr:GntR family transcriptional regulator [Saccharopolyspora soli]MCI2416457.1 GntR family transcriptional regulator [Saccharopolyspora soli]
MNRVADAAGGSRAYQQIVDAVERELASGVLRPGDRLPSEREMVARYGVSRATVREALRVLEHSGLVKSRHGDRSGPLLLDPAGGPLSDTLERIVRLHGCTAGELVGYRMMLESTANQLAAGLRTEEQLAAMHASLAAMRAAIERGAEEFGAADFDFHELVAEASRNTLIQYSLRAARQAALVQIEDKIVRADDERAQMEESLRHHEIVFAAIEAGDGERAASIARHSIFAYYRDYLDEAERAALASLCADENPFLTVSS